MLDVLTNRLILQNFSTQRRRNAEFVSVIYIEYVFEKTERKNLTIFQHNKMYYEFDCQFS